jgi:acyl carrier protein
MERQKIRPEDVEKTVYRLMAKQFDMKEEDIRSDSSLREDLGADSVALIELLVVLEAEFNRQVPDITDLEVHTAGDIVNMIRQLESEPTVETSLSAGGRKDAPQQLQ